MDRDVLMFAQVMTIVMTSLAALAGIEVERISEAQRFMVGLLGDPAHARRADAPLPSRSPGRTDTPH